MFCTELLHPLIREEGVGRESCVSGLALQCVPRVLPAAQSDSVVPAVRRRLRPGQPSSSWWRGIALATFLFGPITVEGPGEGLSSASPSSHHPHVSPALCCPRSCTTCCLEQKGCCSALHSPARDRIKPGHTVPILASILQSPLWYPKSELDASNSICPSPCVSI